MRQMSYSMCRFWAYDESKKILGAGNDAPAWKLAAAGSMGPSLPCPTLIHALIISNSVQREALPGSLEILEVCCHQFQMSSINASSSQQK